MSNIQCSFFWLILLSDQDGSSANEGNYIEQKSFYIELENKKITLASYKQLDCLQLSADNSKSVLCFFILCEMKKHLLFLLFSLFRLSNFLSISLCSPVLIRRGSAATSTAA